MDPLLGAQHVPAAQQGHPSARPVLPREGGEAAHALEGKRVTVAPALVDVETQQLQPVPQARFEHGTAMSGRVSTGRGNLAQAPKSVRIETQHHDPAVRPKNSVHLPEERMG